MGYIKGYTWWTCHDEEGEVVAEDEGLDEEVGHEELEEDEMDYEDAGHEEAEADPQDNLAEMLQDPHVQE